MPSMLDRLFGRRPTEFAIADLDLTKAAKTKAPYLTTLRQASPWVQQSPRRGAQQLRNFSRANEFVRIAIERRRDQISQASWRIVRLDDPEAPPSPQVVSRFADLAKFVNPKRESFGTLLDMIVEDVLVLDAGCIEKEKTLGGGLIALYGVDGASIAPDPNWDGSKLNDTRYRQYINFKLVAELRNDQLVYIQNNPTTFSPVGWSPVETLVRIIEAELWGEQYDYDMLRKAAPAGILDLGTGITAERVEEFREYYRAEIESQQATAIFGGGDPGTASGVKWIPFGYSNREQERMAYKTWLAKKICSVFKLDPMVFGITADTNRSTSGTQKEQTDEGHVTFATRIQNYITREIIWEIDGDHGFVFDDLTPRDETQQSKIDSTYLSAGVWTINEVRSRDGLDSVPWGDKPYVALGAAVPEPGQEPDPNGTPKPGKDEESAKGIIPFSGRRVTGTNGAKGSYLNS